MRLTTLKAVPLVCAWIDGGFKDGYLKHPGWIYENTLNLVCEIVNLVYRREVVGWSMGEFRPGRECRQLTLL